MNDQATTDARGADAPDVPERAVTAVELDQLRVSVAIGEGEVTVHLSGELDPHTAPLLQSQLDDVVAAGATVVVLEMSELGFIDSSGLRVVISARRRVEELGGSLRLRNPSPTVRRLFEITGLSDHIEIEDVGS